MRLGSIKFVPPTGCWPGGSKSLHLYLKYFVTYVTLLKKLALVVSIHIYL